MGKALLWVMVAAGVLLVGTLAVQVQSNRRLAAEVTALRQQVAADAPQETTTSQDRVRSSTAASGNASILQRLDALEQTVGQLVRNSEYLMERGQLPLAGNKAGDLFAKFADVTASDRDRLQAMRLLRRNGGLSDDAVMHALNWLQTATNGGLREDILQQLEGVTNAAVRGQLLAMAASDPDPDVREQAIDNLQRFMTDPQVESELWKMANDPDEDVREQAREAITEGPMTPERAATLQLRTLDANASLDDRMLAWGALREQGRDVPGASDAFAQMVQATQDPFERARMLRELDEVIDRAGPNDSSLLPVIIESLKDPNPLVRQSAADFLNDFRANPAAQEWLKYVAQTDSDAGVRNQAAQPLFQNRR